MGRPRLFHKRGHPDRPVCAICNTHNVPNMALQGPKRGKNRLILAPFCPPQGPFWDILGLEYGPNWYVLLSSFVLFHLFQPKLGPLGQLVQPKDIFSLFWYLLATVGQHLGLSGSCQWSKLLSLDLQPILAPFWPPQDHFWDIIGLANGPTGLSGCLYWCSNLVPPLSIQNRPSGPICVGKRLFLPIFAPFGPPRTTFETFQVLQLVQTSQPGCPKCRSNFFPTRFIKYVVLYGHNRKNANFGPFCAFLGPIEGLNMRSAWSSNSNGGQCTQWDQKKQLMTAMEHF